MCKALIVFHLWASASNTKMCKQNLNAVDGSEDMESLVIVFLIRLYDLRSHYMLKDRCTFHLSIIHATTWILITQHFIKYTVRSSFVRTVFQQTLAGTKLQFIKGFVSSSFVKTVFGQVLLEQCSNRLLLEQYLKL